MAGVRIRVLTYNVHGRRDDSRLMAAMVRELAPDIAIMQEGPRRLRWRQRCAALARDVDLLHCAGGQPAMGNLIMTSLRVTVHGTAVMRYPLTPGRHLRGAVAAMCSIGRVPFVVAGSHLSTDSDERPAQAEAFRGWLGALGHPLASPDLPVPVLVGADVNETCTGPAWKLLADGLVDAAVSAEADHLPTFPSAGPVERLDGLFVDPRVQVLGYQVVGGPTAVAASDHLPVLVDLQLPA